MFNKCPFLCPSLRFFHLIKADSSIKAWLMHHSQNQFKCLFPFSFIYKHFIPKREIGTSSLYKGFDVFFSIPYLNWHTWTFTEEMITTFHYIRNIERKKLVHAKLLHPSQILQFLLPFCDNSIFPIELQVYSPSGMLILISSSVAVLLKHTHNNLTL